MGNETPDHCHSQNYNLKLLLLVILTNFLTICIFIGPSSFKSSGDSDSTKAQLAASFSLISELHQRLNSSNLLVQALLIELTHQQDKQYSKIVKVGSDNYINNAATVFGSDELSLAIGPHKLPFGFSPKIGSDEIQMPFGAACLRFKEELNQFMAYEKGGECPVDDVFGERLMLKGCDPLPRRRCHPKPPTNYEDPKPLPDSLWATPSDTNTIWDPYSCKSYQCLTDHLKLNNNDENVRWLFDDGAFEFGIDQVLAAKPKGTIRIGLDIAGGTGTFAARMMERNVTIITSTLNLEGPFSSFVASRGLVPVHISVSQRLPFFENTLDIVHSSMNGIGNWMPESVFEFAVYDIYRVLRPGGLFWLDHLFCLRSQVKKTYSLIMGQVGFKRLRWHAGVKVGDGGRGRRSNEWYISALLEKPKF